MKRLMSMAVLGLALAGFGGSAFANTLSVSQTSNGSVREHLMVAKEITHQESMKYQKIGDISVSQDGFTMGNAKLAKAATEKGGKYFVIIGQQGQTDHKTIEAAVFK